MFVNENLMSEQLEKNKALFTLGEGEGNPLDNSKAAEPTMQNLMAALQQTQVQTKDYLHTASNIVFKIRPMSSKGYTALHNVEEYNPMTNTKISSNEKDERERAIVYLMHGVAQPPLDYKMAGEVLDAPGWGPSNIGLLDAIQTLNPSAEQRVNNFMILMGLARFQIIWLRVMEETGGFDAYADSLNLTESAKESLRTCIGMFSYLFAIDETSTSWGLPLGVGALTKDTPRVGAVVNPLGGAELPEEKEEVVTYGPSGLKMKAPKKQSAEVKEDTPPEA